MIIYKATNNINGKVYIGQTINTLEQRATEHIGESKGRNKTYFSNALKKYGVDSFAWEVIRICNNINELNAWEQYYILYCNSMNRKFGYNLQSGGLNYIVSDRTKKRMSIANKGKNLSREHREKIGKAHLGKKKSKEHCRNMSISRQNMTNETKLKMSESAKGKVISKETRDKISKTLKGKVLSESTKQKLSIIHKKIGSKPSFLGRKHTVATRKKLSSIGKKRVKTMPRNKNGTFQKLF